jgi:hypothetical protein
MKKARYPFSTFAANIHSLPGDGVRAPWCTNSFGDMRRPRERREPFSHGAEGLLLGAGPDFCTPSAPKRHPANMPNISPWRNSKHARAGGWKLLAHDPSLPSGRNDGSGDDAIRNVQAREQPDLFS